ncbi:hypothetical protein ACWEKR_34495 [Nocardia sp. NPDC004573]
MVADWGQQLAEAVADGVDLLINPGSAHQLRLEASALTQTR